MRFGALGPGLRGSTEVAPIAHLVTGRLLTLRCEDRSCPGFFIFRIQMNEILCNFFKQYSKNPTHVRRVPDPYFSPSLTTQMQEV